MHYLKIISCVVSSHPRTRCNLYPEREREERESAARVARRAAQSMIRGAVSSLSDRARPRGATVAPFAGAPYELRACDGALWCDLRSSWLRCRENGRDNTSYPLSLRSREGFGDTFAFDSVEYSERETLLRPKEGASERERCKKKKKTLGASPSQDVFRPDESGVQLDGEEARERQRGDRRAAESRLPGNRGRRGSREKEQHQVRHPVICHNLCDIVARGGANFVLPTSVR